MRYYGPSSADETSLLSAPALSATRPVLEAWFTAVCQNADGDPDQSSVRSLVLPHLHYFEPDGCRLSGGQGETSVSSRPQQIPGLDQELLYRTFSKFHGHP
jgi:hypothetical protein